MDMTSAETRRRARYERRNRIEHYALATLVVASLLWTGLQPRYDALPEKEREVVPPVALRQPQNAPVAAPAVAEAIDATVYAYNSVEGQTDGNPAVMADAYYVYDGAIACPSRIPFHTRVRILGKTYTCHDRMAARYRDGDNFDIWMESVDDAREWGVKKLIVEVLE